MCEFDGSVKRTGRLTLCVSQNWRHDLAEDRFGLHVLIFILFFIFVILGLINILGKLVYFSCAAFSSSNVSSRSSAASSISSCSAQALGAAIPGHLVVFDRLRGCDKASIQNWPALGRFPCIHRPPSPTPSKRDTLCLGFVEQLEDLIEALHLTFGLFGMVVECLLQIFGGRFCLPSSAAPKLRSRQNRRLSVCLRRGR